ncbi:hypothetical protein PV08_08127 [Exophiala spinifera]|uniref:Glutaredoxin domain-containing protein n=1 Tax=Exophiala spinifera TaxID=91928 RepID=A0A0D2B2V4_9EURO|nr:uncharacterized protein PV08_08127 [Exophiala spinifera]KIW12940.1 hypothetical protein PV08_08127 [Exophiala spinifera]
MAGLRRTHALCLAAAIVLIYILFFSGPDSTDFRRVTESSLSSRRGVLRGSLSDAALTAQTNEQLQMILDKQKEALVASSGRVPNVANTPSNSKDDEMAKDAVAPKWTPTTAPTLPEVPSKPKDNGEDRARAELSDILKKSPVIIFSKSYCPYSKRAKTLLLETYTIEPTPYVVELDLMTEPVAVSYTREEDDDTPPPSVGRKLQDLLASLTGRRTVPNIMINTRSLGGSDDIASMHEKGTLIDEIKKLGGKRIVSVVRNHKAED